MLPIIGAVVAGAVEAIPYVLGAAAVNWAVDKVTGYSPAAAAGDAMTWVGGKAAGGNAVAVSPRSFDLKTASGIRARRSQSDEKGTCEVSFHGNAWAKAEYTAAQDPEGNLRLKIKADGSEHELLVRKKLTVFAEECTAEAAVPREAILAAKEMEKLMNDALAVDARRDARIKATEERLEKVEHRIGQLADVVQQQSRQLQTVIDRYAAIDAKLDALLAKPAEPKPATKSQGRPRAGRPTQAASA